MSKNTNLMRGHFRGAVIRSPEVPDKTLGIGNDENLSPMGITYNIQTMPQKVKSPKVLNQDDILHDIAGINTDDLGGAYGY